MKKKLIINADDFGLLDEVNQAVLRCFEKGSITTASLMVTGEAVEGAVNMAKQSSSPMPLGLHINLTLGRPLYKPQEVSTLVDRDGFFLSRAQMEKRLLLRRVKADEIRRECMGQLKRFKDYGLQLSHVDSHHHVHLFPQVFHVAKEMALKEAVPLRIPWPRKKKDGLHSSWPSLRVRMRRSLLRLLLHYDWVISRGFPFKRVDYFLSIFDFVKNPSEIEPAQYLRILDQMLPGLTEMMVHPAHFTPKLEKTLAIAQICQKELEVLGSMAFKEEAEKRGIELTNFTAVKG